MCRPTRTRAVAPACCSATGGPPDRQRAHARAVVARQEPQSLPDLDADQLVGAQPAAGSSPGGTATSRLQCGRRRRSRRAAAAGPARRSAHRCRTATPELAGHRAEEPAAGRGPVPPADVVADRVEGQQAGRADRQHDPVGGDQGGVGPEVDIAGPGPDAGRGARARPPRRSGPPSGRRRREAVDGGQPAHPGVGRGCSATPRPAGDRVEGAHAVRGPDQHPRRRRRRRRLRRRVADHARDTAPAGVPGGGRRPVRGACSGRRRVGAAPEQRRRPAPARPWPPPRPRPAAAGGARLRTGDARGSGGGLGAAAAGATAATRRRRGRGARRHPRPDLAAGRRSRGVGVGRRPRPARRGCGGADALRPLPAVFSPASSRHSAGPRESLPTGRSRPAAGPPVGRLRLPVSPRSSSVSALQALAGALRARQPALGASRGRRGRCRPTARSSRSPADRRSRGRAPC